MRSAFPEVQHDFGFSCRKLRNDHRKRIEEGQRHASDPKASQFTGAA